MLNSFLRGAIFFASIWLICFVVAMVGVVQTTESAGWVLAVAGLTVVASGYASGLGGRMAQRLRVSNATSDGRTSSWAPTTKFRLIMGVVSATIIVGSQFFMGSVGLFIFLATLDVAIAGFFGACWSRRHDPFPVRHR